MCYNYDKITNEFPYIRQCRQEIEDGICNVILKQQKPVHDKKSSFYIKPQVFIQKLFLISCS